MGDVSQHFSRSEFACKCGCGFDTVDYVLIEKILEPIHKHLSYFFRARVKIVITGGNRCQAYNQQLRDEAIADGREDEAPAKDSTHTQAKAADFKIYYSDGEWKQVSPNFIANLIESEYPNSLGLGRYKNRTHADCRQTKARWTVG